VISVGRPGKSQRGTIGEALEGVTLLVVDPESKKPLPMNEPGLLLVRGPTVFPGYLGENAPNPFIEMEGHTWYNTGDLVRIDSSGVITFAGRLKRFIKSGGEMISLPALEEALAAVYPRTDEGPQVAVEGMEIENGGRLIVLFTTAQITLSEANLILNQAGFRGIMRVDEVRAIPAIPLLGTGKSDYKVLRTQIAKGL
jgi:long-chain-fatty-acid--[acyl-carrier-protein] ligase